MAADHHIQQHQPQQQQPQSQHHSSSRDDSLERLFPRCRLRSPPVDTAVLIDLSDDSNVQQPPLPPPPAAALPPYTRPLPASTMTHPTGQSDSDASPPLRRPPSLKLNLTATGQVQQQQRRYCPSVKYRADNADARRPKLRRPRTVDTWSLYGDVYGAGGYEPSADSEENDSDGFAFDKSIQPVVAPPSSSGSSSSLRRSTPSSTVRTSHSEPHIVGHWKKGGQNGAISAAQRPPRRRGVKEIYDLTPTRLELGSPSAGSAASGGGDGLPVGGSSGNAADPTRMEIAGGREIVSLSRTRTRASQRKQRHSVAHSPPAVAQVESPHNNNNNNSTPSSSNRSINRYSGEVYYEESMGRYGFHVGGGNTLWGSQGLEPSFSIPSNLNDKPYVGGLSIGTTPIDPADDDHGGEGGGGHKEHYHHHHHHHHHHRKHHGLKRPLSWAGDDVAGQNQLSSQQQGTSNSSPDHYINKPVGDGMKRGDKPIAEIDYPSIRTLHATAAIATANGGSGGLVPGIEEPVASPCQPIKSVRGYLTDFYPEVSRTENSTQSGTDPSAGQDPCRPLNLDSYLSEQLNQFAQQSARKEVNESEDVAGQLLSQSPPAQPPSQQLSVATVIGGLTIAQYEGSPRRYGVRPHLAANTNGPNDCSDVDSSRPATNGPLSAPSRSLVPGFPRRVTANPNAGQPQATFSPSTTRQTLVDLTAPSSSLVASASLSTDPLSIIQSPSSPPSNHHLAPSWHSDSDDRSRPSNLQLADQGDTGSLNAETDLGETEVGHEMGKSRNFTLSPETTDYDDSELDVNHTELSVTGVPIESSGSFGPNAGGQTSRRDSNKSQNGLKQSQFSSMPILEDGLSSGQSSAGSASGGESSGGVGGSVTSASDSDEDAVTDRIPLMLDRQRRMKASLSARGGQHPLHPVNNGCRNLTATGSLPPSLSVAGQPNASRSNKLSQQQSLWVKKLSSGTDCDHLHRHHPEPVLMQASFRARDATPPPPAPLAHRPPATHIPSTSPSSASKPFAVQNSSTSAVQQHNSGASPLRLSPGPDTPSVTSGGAGGGSSNSSSCSSSGVGSLAGKMNSQPSKTTTDLSLHELDEALDHGRGRKAHSVPLQTAAGQSPLSHSPPVWVPRQNNDYWVKTSPTSSSTSPRSTHNVGAATGNHLDVTNKLNEDEDERETDQLLRDPDDQGFFDEHARPQVADANRIHPVTRIAGPLPTSPSPPTPSSLRSASTTSSSTQSSPQQQQQTHHLPQQPPQTVATAASAPLTNGTGSNASSSMAGGGGSGGPPPPSRQSEPKDLKYRETPPTAKKKDDANSNQSKKKGRSKEVMVHEPAVLIEGVLFRANYLGSTQIVCEGQPTKYTRMMQAEEAVSRIKDREKQLRSSIGTTTNHSSPLSILYDASDIDDDDEEEDISDVEASLIAKGSTEKKTRIHVNPHCENMTTMLRDCDINANVSTSPLLPPEQQLPTDCTEIAESQQDAARPHLSEHGEGVRRTSSKVIEGLRFRLLLLGTSEIDDLQPDSTAVHGDNRKYRTKKTMVEEAVLNLKAPEGETQPTTEVDLFISTEKIMVLNTELKEIMMDHALRTISYIADIGDLVVLMARRRMITQDGEDTSNKIAKTPKMVCHVFESEEAQFIAQSIGQAFQVAYMEFLKANGIEDQSFVREMDYQEVLNSQEIFGDELQMFAKKELQKEVIVPKARNEILGVVIVESGWGSMLPTVVIANLAPAGAAARCGQLNIGDQIIAINGISLVGLPLSTCQTYIKNAKSATVVKLTVVPCPPVVEVKIKRPDTKYQLGFSVQNGVICSLLRGGIAERGGVRVGHRIIEINGQSVVAVPHERIVGLLATSVGEINMKTMPTSMFRLLIGQETPVYI